MAFNNLSVKNYLDLTFEIFVNKQHALLKKLTSILLCSSHITKNMKNDIVKFFKGDDVFFVASVIGGIFDLKSFSDIDSYIKEFLVIIMSKFNSERCNEALRKFNDFADREDWPSDEIEDEYHQDFEEFETIYKHSKFFQRYDEFIRSFKETSSESDSKNKYYRPKFAALFNKKYLAFLPFWSAALTAIRGNSQGHSNNGSVEGN